MANRQQPKDQPNPSVQYGQLTGNKRKPKAQPRQGPQSNETGQASIVHSYNLLLHSHDSVKNSDGSYEWVKQNGWARTIRDTDLLRFQFIHAFASLRNYYFINQTNDRIMMRLMTRDENERPIGCIGPVTIKTGSHRNRQELNRAMQKGFDDAFRSCLNAMNNYVRTNGRDSNPDGIFSKYTDFYKNPQFQESDPDEREGIYSIGKFSRNVCTVLQIADGQPYGFTDVGTYTYSYPFLQVATGLQPNDATLREFYSFNYRNITGDNVPWPEPPFINAAADESTFTRAYEKFVDSDVHFQGYPGWYSVSPDRAKGQSQRAMFAFQTNFSEPQEEDAEITTGTFEASPGMSRDDFFLSRDAGIFVQFFSSDSAPQGTQVFGAYGNPSMPDYRFAVGRDEPFFDESLKSDTYFTDLFSVVEFDTRKQPNVWVTDHVWKYFDSDEEGNAIRKHQGVGFSPLKTMLGSENNHHIYVRLSEVNAKNLMSSYLGNGFDAATVASTQKALPSDVLGVIRTNETGDFSSSTYSDASGAEHSNGWFMLLSDKVVSRLKIRLTDSANQNVATFEDNNQVKAQNGIPFSIALRADVIRNVDNERVQSQPTAQGVTYTTPHAFLSDTSVGGTNEHPYTNKPVF